MVRERCAAQLADQPDQIWRESHVQGARPDRLLIAGERNAKQRIRVYRSSGNRRSDVQCAVAGPRVGQGSTDRLKDVFEAWRDRNDLVAQQRQTFLPFAEDRRPFQRQERRVGQRRCGVERQPDESLLKRHGGCKIGQLCGNSGPKCRSTAATTGRYAGSARGPSIV